MTLAEFRRRQHRALERLRAREAAAAGRVHEARAIVAALNGPLAAIEVNQTTVTRSLDRGPVVRRAMPFDVSDVDTEVQS